MSYTINIKNEIINKHGDISQTIAELSAILNVGVKIEKNKFLVQTENLSVARRIYKLLKDLYHIDVEIITDTINRLGKKYLSTIIVKEKKDFILKDLKIIDESKKRLYICENYIIDTIEEKQAYLKGVFLICGSINDPKTARYHAEFIINNKKTAEFISKLMNSLNYNSKVLKREKHYMVYIKESESISDFIKLLGANNSLFYFEDIRIYRDHKNMTNRLNNCEQANADKVVFTSNKQLKLIEELKQITDFDLLDEKIKDVCIYKEKYPESSLQELAEIISIETNKKITKSGINHRFRKIKEMVENKN